jgi:hypothetical protein
MDPIKEHKRALLDNWPSLLAYLSKVRSMLKEVERLGVFNLFNTVSNIRCHHGQDAQRHSEEVDGLQQGLAGQSTRCCH